MPPRRRAAAAAQSTLSFGSQSRITKPSTTPHKGKKLDAPATDPVKSTSDTPEPHPIEASEASESLTPHTTDLAFRQQTSPSRKPPQPEEDKQALKLTLADLKRYWQAKEGTPKPYRVHEGDVKLEEKILRNFDHTIDYGPCVGIDRIQRWRRAHRFGLNPPIEVLTILLKGEDMSEASNMEKLIF